MSILRFWLDDVDQDFVIHVKLVKRTIAGGWKFFCGEDALRFEANIDQDFVLVNTHDYALDHIAAFDIDGTG